MRDSLLRRSRRASPFERTPPCSDTRDSRSAAGQRVLQRTGRGHDDTGSADKILDSATWIKFRISTDNVPGARNLKQ